MAAWNAMATDCALPCVARLNDKREKHCKLRIEEHGIATILAAIGKIPESAFLLGRTQSGDWKANFDWLIQPSSMQKLIEGNYHGRGGKGSGWLDA